jgi:hypothetical protein
MIQESEHHTFEELVEVLKRLCQRRASGTLFIHTNEGHHARIALDGGRVFSITYGRYRGQQALAYVKKIPGGRYTFADTIFNSESELPLPETDQLLAVLSDAAKPSEGTAARPPHDPDDLPAELTAWMDQSDESTAERAPETAVDSSEPPPAPEPQAQGADSVGQNQHLTKRGQALYEYIVAQMSEHVGPVAGLICEEYETALRELDDVERLAGILEELGSQIENPDLAWTIYEAVVHDRIA